MKAEEKKRARELRQKGYSLKEIQKELKVAKSSVSLWVRDIVLSKEQLRELKKKGHNTEVIEKRRKTRLQREDARRQKITDAAKAQVTKVSKDNLFFIAVALYWAEGSKKKRGMLEFSNSDPAMIQIMMRFLRETVKVPEDRFRGHVYLHPHLNATKAEKYWSDVSDIPKKQFFKTSQQHNRASKNKKDSLPYGTFSVVVCSTELYLNMMGWIEKMSEILNKKQTK